MNPVFQCLVVDDEPIAVDVIKTYIEQVPQLTLAGTCGDAMEAYQILGQKRIDLIFLDIEMPGMKGIEFIRSLDNPPPVILTTAYRDYALESYELNVVDYLLKPVSFTRFFRAVDKFLKQHSPGKLPVTDPAPPEVGRGFMYVYADKKNVKLYFDDILYIESIKDYVRIHTVDQNIISKDTIKRYEDLLPSGFLRVHRSFIVNSARITAYTAHDIELDEKQIPIGVSYKQKVMAYLK